jgi:hypothetical protein
MIAEGERPLAFWLWRRWACLRPGGGGAGGGCRQQPKQGRHSGPGRRTLCLVSGALLFLLIYWAFTGDSTTGVNPPSRSQQSLNTPTTYPLIIH